MLLAPWLFRPNSVLIALQHRKTIRAWFVWSCTELDMIMLGSGTVLDVLGGPPSGGPRLRVAFGDVKPKSSIAALQKQQSLMYIAFVVLLI